MSPLLDEPGFRKRALPLSVQAWHRMIAEGLAPEKSELLRGVIIEKMPKSILHIQLIVRLLQMLQSMLGNNFWVRPEAPLSLADSEPEPDISVVVGRDIDYAAHPVTAKLVVEISVSTLAEDRGIASIYAEAEVEEYWIINARERSIEIFRHPVDGIYQTSIVTRAGDEVECLALPGVHLAVSTLFEGLAG